MQYYHIHTPQIRQKPKTFRWPIAFAQAYRLLETGYASDAEQNAPNTWIAARTAVIFMQFARQESFLTPERVKEYSARVSEPKQMKIYDAPHALNAEARRDRAAFLQKQLRLKPIDMAKLAKVPELIKPREPKR